MLLFQKMFDVFAHPGMKGLKSMIKRLDCVGDKFLPKTTFKNICQGEMLSTKQTPTIFKYFENWSLSPSYVTLRLDSTRLGVTRAL